MTRTEIPTFCRICEAECGVIAVVEGNAIVDVRADKDNPHSRGFMCTKPRAMVDVVYDPDRVLTPLKRIGAPGEFAPCTWDEALDDIAARLKDVVGEHGAEAFAVYQGNPAGMSTAGPVALTGLRDALGGSPSYGVNGEDHGSYVAALALQYGSGALFARPDLWRTDFLIMSGANPWVSKGSTISEPNIREAMNGIVERGGRVVVIDPRRTETARHFEHVAPRPGTDAWLLLGLLKVMVDERLVDNAFLNRHVNGYAGFAAAVGRVDLARCAELSGVPVDTIVDIARGFATAGAAAAYCRTGLSTQRFGTLNNMLINALNIVTGNINKPGGSMFGWGAIDFPKLAKAGGLHSYAPNRSRGGLPQTLGQLPTQSLWRDISEPGADRIRAMCTYSGNPVSSSGAGGERLANALEQLDLHFSLDFYINETNKYAHYILPSPTFYEREDLPVIAMALELRPTLFATPKVLEPRGESREEWVVFNEIARRMGLGGAYSVAPLRWLARIGRPLNPMTLMDAAIRTGPVGDLFGLRRKGWSLKKLRSHPHGVSLADELPVQKLEKLLATADRKVHLATSEFLGEVDALMAHSEGEDYPLRAVGLRELRSHNSWLHNSPRLNPESRKPAVLVHPVDAAAAGVSDDGESIDIESASGVITMAVTLTEDMRPGTVAIPHGWGHSGGWQRANRSGGANSNDLVSTENADIERLAGMSILSGIPVRIRAHLPAAERVSARAAR